MVKIQRTQKDEAIKDKDNMIALLNTYNNQTQSRINTIENGFKEINEVLEDIKKTLKNEKEVVRSIQQKNVIYDENLEYDELLISLLVV